MNRPSRMDARRERPAARHPYALAAGLGALTGMRSMTGPTVLALALRRDGDPHDTSFARAVASHPALAGALAAGEMLADKHPRIPPRTEPLPHTGRVAIGALVGAAAATHGGGRRALGALIGALTASAATHASYAARAKLQSRFADGSLIPGLVEDAVVVLGGAALLAALRRSRSPRTALERAVDGPTRTGAVPDAPGAW